MKVNSSVSASQTEVVSVQRDNSQSQAQKGKICKLVLVHSFIPFFSIQFKHLRLISQHPKVM